MVGRGGVLGERVDILSSGNISYYIYQVIVVKKDIARDEKLACTKQPRRF